MFETDGTAHNHTDETGAFEISCEDAGCTGAAPVDFDAEFASLMSEVAPELAKVEAEVKPAKDGLAYVHDIDGASGHAISVYAMTLNGRHIFNVLVDNFVEVPVPADMGKAPVGVTAHAIVVAKPGQASGITTNGLAFRAPHGDGTGTHIDGRSVQSFIYPRVVRFLIDLYV